MITKLNALDEHIKYNIKKPIDIFLPNYFDNHLIIRDYAKGLSMDFMTNYYTKVGYSTKATNNDLLGGFGLGRMSPLAYTDMYVVISITDEEEGRVKCEYVISKDNNKVFCSLLSKETTTKDTGVEISFEIKDNDIANITSYVFNNTRYLYNVAVAIDNELVIPEPIVNCGRYFKCIKNDSHSGNLLGLIGGLPNKIDLYNYKETLKSSDYEYLGKIVLNKKIVFDIEIGKVDQSADKDIQLSQKTKVYIAECLSNIVTEYKQYVKDKLDELEHWDDVQSFLVSSNLLFGPITWKGRSIPYNSWLKQVISFNKTKKGNIVQCKDKYHYFNKAAIYYYNDIPYSLTVKTLSKYIKLEELENTCLVNDVDNNIFNFRLLSSVVPSTDLNVKKKTNTTKKVSVNAKCYRLSTYPGVLGRELNIDTTKSYYYISRKVFNLSSFFIFKQELFNYCKNEDIYVVDDPALVRDCWKDLIEDIQQTLADKIDTNYFIYYSKIYGVSTILQLDNKDLFIVENPDSPITLLLIESKKYTPYLSKHYLIRSLHEAGLITIKKAELNLFNLITKINKKYPLIEQSIKHNSSQDMLMRDYIKQIDYYNKNQNV